jgi:hypothetical protein
MDIRVHHLSFLEDLIVHMGPNPENLDSMKEKAPLMFLEKSSELIANFYLDMIRCPEMEITLIDSVDIICRDCENCQDGECKKYESMREYDDQYMKYFNKYFLIECGKTYKAKEIIQLLSSEPFSHRHK